MDIRYQHSLSRPFTDKWCMAYRDIRAEELVREEEPAVIGKSPPDPNYLVRKEALGIGETGTIFVEKDRDMAG